MTEKTTLTQLQFRGATVVIELSSHEQPLVIEQEAAYRFQLAKGTVLTESQVAQLEYEATRLACRQEGTRLMALRQHSVAELRLKLRRKGFPDEAAAEVIALFRERGVLDDTQYAQALATSLLARKPCGRGYLIAHLESKRIERSLANDVVDGVLAGWDQEGLAVQALRARWREFGQFDLETARRKAYNYLARRGFSFQASRAAFETLTGESTDGG